jgi:drug/metabolite transporter, DME family
MEEVKRSGILTYPMGILLGFLGGVALSFGGVIFHAMDNPNAWQILFYRTFSFEIVIISFMLLRYRSKVVSATLSIGKAGLIGGVFLGMGFCFYVFALLNTTVASALFLLSGGPLMTALLAWLLIKERINKMTAFAILLTMGGVTIMVSEGLGNGNIFGDLCALAAALTFGLMVISYRSNPGVDMVPATGWGGLVAMAISAFMMPEFEIDYYNLGLALLLGVVTVGVGFILITLASIVVPSAELSLIVLSEAVFGPLWVLLVYGIVPANTTMFGGAVVFFALMLYAYAAKRSSGAT